MSKMLASLITVAGLTFAASPAFASGTCTPWQAKIGVCSFNPPTYSVPELSATAAPISIALVGGLLAFGLERRRKQSKK